MDHFPCAALAALTSGISRRIDPWDAAPADLPKATGGALSAGKQGLWRDGPRQSSGLCAKSATTAQFVRAGLRAQFCPDCAAFLFAQGGAIERDQVGAAADAVHERIG